MSSPASQASEFNGAAFLSELLNIGGAVAIAKATTKPAQNISGTAVSNAAPASTTSPIGTATPSDNRMLIYGGLALAAAALLVVLVRSK